MTKFRIIEIKQTVREDIKQRGKQAADIVQSIANIGRLFGVKTEFLTSMTNLVSNVMGIWKTIKERTTEQLKVINALQNNSPAVDKIIKKSLGISDIIKNASTGASDSSGTPTPTPPTPTPPAPTPPAPIPPTPKTEEEIKAEEDVVSGLRNMGMTVKAAKKALADAQKENPKLKDFDDLMKASLKATKGQPPAKIPKANRGK